MTKGGSLGVEGKGKAPHWRLTELGYMHELPTRDFDRWTGAKFTDRKIKPRRPSPHTRAKWRTLEMRKWRTLTAEPRRKWRTYSNRGQCGNPAHT